MSFWQTIIAVLCVADRGPTGTLEFNLKLPTLRYEATEWATLGAFDIKSRHKFLLQKKQKPPRIKSAGGLYI